MTGYVPDLPDPDGLDTRDLARTIRLTYAWLFDAMLAYARRPNRLVWPIQSDVRFTPTRVPRERVGR